jgi:predicted MFS family arabinose efflux permease
MLVNRSGTMVVPFLTMYCHIQLGFTVAQSGFVLSLFGGGAIVGAFIGGRIVDAWGFYPLQLAALLIGGTMFIVVGFLHNYVSLCIGTFILSTCNESFRPANSTAIAHYSAVENRTRSFSLNRLSINLGWAVGGALGGFLASVNYHLLFWVDGCTNILAAGLLLKLLPFVKSGSKRKTVKHVQANKASLPYYDKAYMFFIVLTILFASCFFQLFSMEPLFYKTQWNLNERFIGVLMALNGIIIVGIEMILVYSLEGTRPLTHFIRTGIFLVGVGFVLLNILPHIAWVAVLSICIVTVGEILSMPFMNSFWISRTAENNRGQYAAMYTIAWSVGQIAGPYFGSQVIEKEGYNNLWWLVAGMCFIASLGFSRLGRYVRK